MLEVALTPGAQAGARERRHRARRTWPRTASTCSSRRRSSTWEPQARQRKSATDGAPMAKPLSLARHAPWIALAAGPRAGRTDRYRRTRRRGGAPAGATGAGAGGFLVARHPFARFGRRPARRCLALLALWALGFAAAALLVAWPLAALRQSGSLPAALGLSAVVGAVLIGLWRTWPLWQGAGARRRRPGGALARLAGARHPRLARPGRGRAGGAGDRRWAVRWPGRAWCPRTACRGLAVAYAVAAAAPALGIAAQFRGACLAGRGDGASGAGRRPLRTRQRRCCARKTWMRPCSPPRAPAGSNARWSCWTPAPTRAPLPHRTRATSAAWPCWPRCCPTCACCAR